MQVDAFGHSKSDEWSDWLSVADPTEVTAFYEGVAAGLGSEIPDEPVHPDPTDQPLDALYRKGKGKGKGKNRFREKGQGKGYQGGDGGKGQGQSSSSSKVATKAEAKATGSSSSSKLPAARVEMVPPAPISIAAGAT